MLEALTPENRAWLVGAADGAGRSSTTASRSATARRSTRTLHLRRARRAHAFDAATRAGLLLRPHAFRGRLPAGRATRSDVVGPAGERRHRAAARAGGEVPGQSRSVGQPRDGDPRAAYAIFDTDDAAGRSDPAALRLEDHAGEDAARRACPNRWRAVSRLGGSGRVRPA